MIKQNQRWKFSLGSIRQWHWISSALCLAGMLLFAITGITLNHAADIAADIQVTTIEAKVPTELVSQLSSQHQQAVPTKLLKWLADEEQLYISADSKVEWSDDELYVSLPRPGGDAWLSLDLLNGDLSYEKTERGVVSYLNDLHKGRNTGKTWFWFIDLFAVACVVFCVTGLVLLYRYAGPRPTTWPVVGLGVVIPVLLIILFVHS
ncbi:PepSY-associated TM helix domain-containing protein [Paraglaciecola sp.]|uniref:PepSY-associated TM helix domain-containing protein n=1 Tax=Paraglaciecola sp. TaxID=1920173 RepID=UPI0030F4A527